MKKSSVFILLLFVFTVSLSGGAVRQLEENLRKSSPGLPEFRVFSDMFGVIRTVRTLPGEKRNGVFKLKVLSGHRGITMLDVTGVKEADLEGLAGFKELKSLRIGADTVRGLEKAVLPNVVRLDLSRTGVKDVSWIKNFPGLRILRLPESVTDITPLKGRSFRALSIPGVAYSDDVCRSLNISVAIRTAHAYRRPGRDRLPPVTVERDSEGRITGLKVVRSSQSGARLKGFAGELFPEERRMPGVPPEIEDYPQFKGAKRSGILKASVFAKDSATLQKLDLRALRGVQFAGESFPELRELYLSGAVGGLHTLKAPKLKKVCLEMVEGVIPGAVLEHRRGAVRTLPYPGRREAQKIRLGSGWDLEQLSILPRRDEFDFSSLQQVQFNFLECYCNGRDLAFLKGKKVNRLILDAPQVSGKGGAVLGTLPLKELKLALNPQSDFSFLRKLKLRKLVLSNCAGSNFSISYLRQMPLESLRLRHCFNRKVDLTPLKLPRLRELVLDSITFTRAEFLRNFPKLESLALENCVFAPAGLSLRTPDIDYLCGDRLAKSILKLGKLRNLRLGPVGVFSSGERLVNYEFPLERFKVLKLENFSFCGERADFAKEYPVLKRLKIDDISRFGIAPLEVKTKHELETLVLTNVRPRPDRPVPELRFLFRRPMMPAPQKEPGVAKQVYQGGPGGFNGGFLR